MLLGGNGNPTAKRYSEGFDEQYKRDIDFSVSLMQSWHFEEAWIFMESLKTESIPLLFNKAICLYDTQQTETILRLLDKVWMLLGPMQGGMKGMESPELSGIRKVEKDQVHYLNGITLGYVDAFPHILKDSVLRMMVDCYYYLGNTAKVIEIGTPLLRKGYRNVLEAFYKIDHPDPYEHSSAGYEVGEDGKVYFVVDGEKQE